jgi:hypothetical protein
VESEPNNPASRLLRIVRDGQKQSKTQTAAESWASVLEVPLEDKPLLLSRVGHVMALPEAIRSELEQVENINHALHLKWLPSVETSFSIHNLNMQWKQFIDRFNPETIYGLEVCGDVLSRNRPEKTVDHDSARGLLNDIRDLITELAEIQLPEDLHSFLYEHLKIVKDALEEYKIKGMKPLEAEVERLTGAVARNPEFWIRTKETDFGERFWNAMGKLAIVTTIVAGQLQIGQEVFSVMSPGQEQAPTFESNWEININVESLETSGSPDDASPILALPPKQEKT